MKGLVSSLAVLYVVLLPVGRSGLPLNAQWGDLLLPVLAAATLGAGFGRNWLGRGDWPLALYLAATLVTAVLSPEAQVGITQLAKQLSVVLVFLVFRRIAGRDPSLTHALQKAFVATFALVAAVSILVVFLRLPSRVPLAMLGAVDTLPFFGLVKRLRGAFLTPEMLGNALLVAFVLALGLRAAASGRARSRWSAMAAILVAGEFLTFSHSVAGFAVAAVFFAAGSHPSRPARSLAWIGALSVVGVVTAASVIEPGPVVNDYGVGRVRVDVMGKEIEGSLNHYAALKQVAWSAFLDHPLKGVGPGRFPVETERAFQEGRFNARYRHKPPQCDLAGRFAETGLLGGLSLVLLWASWLRPEGSHHALPAMRRAAFAAVIGILVNSLNADVMNFRFLWLALAWAATPNRDETATSAPFTRA